MPQKDPQIEIRPAITQVDDLLSEIGKRVAAEERVLVTTLTKRMVVNLFLHSDGLAFAISAIGVLIFAGLTAWDTQKIKTTYVEHAAAMDQEWLGKSAIMGALNLYLDFINLFMFLLQFMGNRE